MSGLALAGALAASVTLSACGVFGGDEDGGDGAQQQQQGAQGSTSDGNTGVATPAAGNTIVASGSTSGPVQAPQGEGGDGAATGNAGADTAGGGAGAESAQGQGAQAGGAQTGGAQTTPGGQSAAPPSTESTTPVDPTTGAPVAAGGSGVGATVQRLPIDRFFNEQSPWNTPVEGAPVDEGSEKLIRRATRRRAVVDTSEGIDTISREIKVGLTINVTRWTVPVFSDIGGQQTVARCRQRDCGPDSVASIVLPPDARPDPRFDGWMTVVDTQNRTALDLWRARRERDGVISYQFARRWDLDGPGFQQPDNVSARGSGLPLFAGLIRPEEIDDGRIDHALAISVPGGAQRRYVQPASATDGNGAIDSLPEGARIRLRPGSRLSKRFVRNSRHRRSAEVIVAALERYGAIVVDRSAAPTMYAQRNARWRGILPLNVVQSVDLEEFEVVELPRRFAFPPRAEDVIAGQGIDQPLQTPSGEQQGTQDPAAGGSSGGSTTTGSAP